MEKYATPGVYVEETKNLSLSVNSSDTAIPIIAATDADFGLLEKDAKVNYFEVSGWLDVIARAGTVTAKPPGSIPVAKPKIEGGKAGEGKAEGVPSSGVDATESGVDTATSPPAAATDSVATFRKAMLGRALAAYFANGGGRAYICKSGALGTAAALLTDATLLVEAGANLAASAVTAVCKSGSGIFGVLDAPNVTRTADASALNKGITKDENVAIYHPWLRAGDADVPPSAAAAGIYAKVDSERGVWKAPANVAVVGAIPKYVVTDAEQAKLNDADTPINVIRIFNAGSSLVWGARTGSKESQFRYIPVRRLFNMLERDIRKAMRLVQFEPNTSATWETARTAIENYLYEIWRQGGFAGETPSDAYRVMIGEGITMSASQIQQGLMIAEVAVAPSRPAEFIVLRFSEKTQGA